MVVEEREPQFVEMCMDKWKKGCHRGARWDKVQGFTLRRINIPTLQRVTGYITPELLPSKSLYIAEMQDTDLLLYFSRQWRKDMVARPQWVQLFWASVVYFTVLYRAILVPWQVAVRSWKCDSLQSEVWQLAVGSAVGSEHAR